MMNTHRFAPILTLAVAALTGLVLSGCVDAPPPRHVYREATPPPPQANTDVYAYPQQGQSPEQQDRDRYDCHLWAVKQSGFDPSAPGVPPHERVRVVSAGPPPGAGTAVGAIAGAILGAAIAGPRNAGFGAVAGGITGAAVGNASDQAQAAANQQVVVQQDARQSAAMERQASNYRRAIGACLEARGYSVK
jgi:Glycine zipper 2TM domain